MQISWHLLPKPFWKDKGGPSAAAPPTQSSGGQPDPTKPVPIADIHLTAAIDGKQQSQDIPIGIVPRSDTVDLGKDPKGAIATALKATGKEGAMAVLGVDGSFVGKQAVIDPKVATLLLQDSPPKGIAFDLFKLVPEAQALVIGQKVMPLADPPKQEGSAQQTK